MKKLELINAELARLHTTYVQLIQSSREDGEEYFGQLDAIQSKMSRLYQIIDDYIDTNDDDDYYLMDDDDDEEEEN
jgi:hypothetical protein